MTNRLLKLFAVIGVLSLLATPSFAAKKVKWNLAMTWPKTLVPLVHPSQKLSQLLEEMSGGKFIIKVDGAGKHKSPLGIFNMVKGGQYQIGHSSSYYYKGIDMSMALLTTSPFGMTTAEQYSWYYYGGGEALTKKVFDKHGMLSFPSGNTGVQMGGWFAKEIKSLEDLKGLKMRIPGMAGEIFAKLGVTVTNIAPGELFTSLQMGTIDALEWVGPSMDIKMGFYKIAPFYYTGWHEPASDMHFYVNERAYKKLPDEYKTMLKTAIRMVGMDMYFENYDLNAEAWQQMKKEYPNIKVKTFPKKVLKAMKKATDEVMMEYSKKDPLFKEIYESQSNYLKKVRPWTKLSDYDYIRTNEMVK